MTMEQPVEPEGSSFLTARSRSIKFTPQRIQQITNLVERGKSREEIAHILDVTVGSLQVTCSRLGISLGRRKIIDGIGLLPKPKPLYENASLTSHSGGHVGRVPLQPTEKQLSENSAPSACSASFAIRLQCRGIERTYELPLTTHTIGQLALEAALQGVTIGELFTKLITAILSKDLIPQLLGKTDPATDPVVG
jgi:hypothetical protein